MQLQKVCEAAAATFPAHLQVAIFLDIWPDLLNRMHVRHCPHLLGLLITVLVFSTVVPCGLLELEEDPFCTAQSLDPGVSGAEEAPGDVDCCAGCLTCCASSLEANVPHVVFASVPTFSLPFRLVRGPKGARIPIWHPPRA